MGRAIGLSMAAILLVFAVLMVQEVEGVRYIVGGRYGWTQGQVNYTEWAHNITFYNGDWLFFVYDRNQMNILELNNQTDYDLCNTEHPRHNWTTGAGRDVVPLNVTRNYYFASGKGFCFGGMKLAIHVHNPPPPPRASPIRNSSPGLTSSFRRHVFVPALFAIAAMWESLLLLV